MRLRVPVTLTAAALLSAPASASATFAHVVAPGESLSSVAASDGLSVEELATANGLSPDASLIAGSTLTIPPQSEAGVTPETAVGETISSGEAAGKTVASGEAAGESSAGSSAGDGDADSDDGGAAPGEAATEAGSSEASAGSYLVQPGDTLTAIAARSGTSVDALAAANGVDPSAPLIAGTALRLSAASGETSAPHSSIAEGVSAASAQPEGAEAQGSSGAPPYPTAQSVSPAEVGSIASENGVPPSLAQAIADQESGFNNGLTSSADARGVMQILPGTWSWINETLASQSPLEPASAASNVRGGVLLLHSLLESTGGDPALAAAGYYQGLPSVLQEGELPSTRQYVENVLELQRQFGGE